MLVLSRRIGQEVLFPSIAASIRILDVKRGAVRLGIDAPPAVNILRAELQDRHVEWAQAAAPAENPDSGRLFDSKLQDANTLVGLARLQLQVGFAEAARTTLERVSEELQALRRSQSPESALPARRQKALLVEDNDNERELLARFLRVAGLEVDTAGDGADALDYLRHHRAPDIVLMDMGLPRCDGPTAVREIRRDPRTAGVKVFAVTGHLPGDFDLATGPAGIDAWFTKPVDPDDLVQRLRQEFAKVACPA